MRFWDTSAVVPLIVREAETRRMREILSQDDVMAVFYATEIECVSAFSRRLREGSMNRSSFDGAIDILTAEFIKVDPLHRPGFSRRAPSVREVFPEAWNLMPEARIAKARYFRNPL